MEAVSASDVDAGEYVGFLDGLAAQPGSALAYHYPFYLRFLADVAYPGSRLRFVSARDARGVLVGMMPALHVQTPCLNVWLSLAYFGPNAGALVRDAGGATRPAAVAALTRAAKSDACRLGCGSMTIYTPLGADASMYHDGLGGADFDVPRTAQSMPIPADPEQSPWPRKVRYDIRRAAALGVSVRRMAHEGDLDAVWRIYHDSGRDMGIPIKPLDHIRALYRTALDRGVFLVAEHDGEIIGGLVAFIGGGVLSYYLPCTRPEKRALQPGLALLDRAVALARDAGCRLLNFEGSPGIDSSVFRFKERCGGEPVDYRVLVKLLRPGVLDEYRALSRDALMREVPQAFVVPFEALA
jgi:hypothetical protein